MPPYAKKIKLYTKLVPKCCALSIHTKIYLRSYFISPSSTKVLAQLEHRIELLLDLLNQIRGLIYPKMHLITSNTHILSILLFSPL